MSYDLEMYAKAMEAMAKQPDIRPPEPKDNLFEYAQRVTWERGYQCGVERAWKQAANMLRLNPWPLWTVYPGHFPEPKEPADDPR